MWPPDKAKKNATFNLQWTGTYTAEGGRRGRGGWNHTMNLLNEACEFCCMTIDKVECTLYMYEMFCFLFSARPSTRPPSSSKTQVNKMWSVNFSCVYPSARQMPSFCVSWAKEGEKNPSILYFPLCVYIRRWMQFGGEGGGGGGEGWDIPEQTRRVESQCLRYGGEYLLNAT